MLDRAQLLRRFAAGAAAAPLAGLLAERAAAAGGGGDFPPHPRWTFAFISDQTTNPLLVALQYGIQDACALVDCQYTWSGSAIGSVQEMQDAFQKALAAKPSGIALSIVDPKAFDQPVARAMRAGVPVVSFVTDAPGTSSNQRLAFTGVSPYAVGYEAGTRFAKASPRGELALLVGTAPDDGARARLNGAKAAIAKAGGAIHLTTFNTGDTAYDANTRLEAWFPTRRNLRGMLAVDPASTLGLGAVMEKYALGAKGIRAAGFGVFPAILQFVARGGLAFTIDEQPYLQGFYPLLQLFLYKLSGGLVAPADMRTGPLFVTRSNVGPYVNTHTRFEGSSSKQRYPIA